MDLLDPLSWPKQQKLDFLHERGVTECEELSEDELLALIISFLDTDKLSEQFTETADERLQDQEDPSLVWKECAGDISSPGDYPNSQSNNILLANNCGSGSSGDDKLSDSNLGPLQEVLDTFCEITGCEKSTGKHLLEALGWDLDTAVSMYMEGLQDAPVPRANTLPSPPHPPRSSAGSGLANVMSGIDANAWNAGTGTFEREYPRLGGQGFRGGYDNGSDDDDFGRIDQYDDFGVRRPDEVRTQRLMGPGSQGIDEGDSLARAEEEGVEWMFPPPRHISFPGTFQDARELAKQDKKWLLVNIQHHVEFSSHMLNRDTWSSETVEALLRSSFVFWQRGSTSVDAKTYMRLHNLTEEMLPHIAIIDARTGSKVHVIKGFILPEDLSLMVMEFIEENDLTRGSVTKVIKPGSRSNSFAESKNKTSDARNLSFSDRSDLKAPDTDAAVAALQTEKFEKECSNATISVDYGTIPVEPDAGVSDSIKISIKLPSGKPFVRRFTRDTLVRGLYAVAVEALGSAPFTPFDIFTVMPSKSLAGQMDKTVAETDLNGQQVRIILK